VLLTGRFSGSKCVTSPHEIELFLLAELDTPCNLRVKKAQATARMEAQVMAGEMMAHEVSALVSVVRDAIMDDEKVLSIIKNALASALEKKIVQSRKKLLMQKESTCHQDAL
jgi:hypothetical protein